MATGHEKRKPKQNNPIEAISTEGQKSIDNQRKEKFADYLIDVSKYVLTGVVITSLFNDVTDRTTIYLVGLGVVCLTLWLGLMLTNNKRKEK